MKRTARILAVLLALVLLLGLLPVMAEYPAETGSLDLTKSWKGKTVILHTNDVHGAISGYAVAAHMKLRLEHQGAEVLLVDAGDFSQGAPAVNNDKGASAIRLMNAAGYDLAIPGNHEFDYGVEQLESNLAAADFPVICASIFREDGSTLLPPSWTYTGASGLTIGFFGLDTPECQTKASPALVRGLTFLAGQELYDCAQAQADALREDGADLVIALTHLGVHGESEPSRSQDVYAAVSGIDLVIDGHSHTLMTAGEAGEPIQSTGTQSVYIGVVIIDNRTKTIESRYLVPLENAEQDPTVSAIAAEIKAEVESAYDEVIGASEVELEGDRAYNRTQETNHGNLSSDALYAYIRKRQDTLHTDADHMISLINGGSIREYIHVGPITRGDVNTVHPFGNTLCVVYCTGAQLLEILEASTFRIPEQVGGFPHCTGLQWTIDTTKPYDKGELYPASTYRAPVSIRRVSIQSVNGLPFSETDTYAVVTSDFCATGGDTYYVFSPLESFDTGVPLDDVVTEYIRDDLGGVIGQEYAAPRGDLQIVTVENSRCVPSAQRILLNGEEVQPEAYNINGENYVMLRDLAMLLNGTSARFAVSYDQERNSVALTPGEAYTPVGGELAPGADRSGALKTSKQSLTAAGEALNLCAYNLGGNNFFRLQDLAPILGFDAEYDTETDTVLLTSGE